MKSKVFSIEGKEVKDIELNDYVFNCDVSEGSIYYAIKNENANKRVGAACTKTRGEVRGTTAKPYKQKGTGRARAGRRRSPVWVGGGVVFGPRPRDYSYSIPKKVKKLAVRSILTSKLKDGRLKIVEDFSVDTGKTKDLLSILSNFCIGERTVLVLKDDDVFLKRAARNIPWLTFLSYNRMNAHDLFYAKNILLLETSVLNLNSFYGK